MLLGYFAAGEDRVILNTVFMMLFTPPHTPSPSPSPSPSGFARTDVFTPGTATATLSDRMRILARLVSAAVASRNLAVLNCTGVWMQQLVFSNYLPKQIDLSDQIVFFFFSRVALVSIHSISQESLLKIILCSTRRNQMYVETVPRY